VLGTLATAAAVLFVVRSQPATQAAPAAHVAVDTIPSPSVSVEALDPGTTAIIFGTPNPDYDIVWFYQGD
jgi:hypothetical protein